MDCVINSSEKPFYILIRARGAASADRINSLLEELCVLEDYPAGIGILLDLRDLDLDNLSAANLLYIIGIIKIFMGNEISGPCAAVVDNPVAFGLARMYGLLGGEMLHAHYSVFYNPDDAALWLLGRVLTQQRKGESGMNRGYGELA